jgi:hypothetical protein
MKHALDAIFVLPEIDAVANFDKPTFLSLH